MNQTVLSFTIVVVGSLLTFMATTYWHMRKEKQTLAARIVEIERQLALIGQSVIPINAAFQAILIKELTHFHTPEVDRLLVKVGPPYSLTVDEERQLAHELEKRSEDLGEQMTESERDAAIILPYVIKRTRGERRSQ